MNKITCQFILLLLLFLASICSVIGSPDSIELTTTAKKAAEKALVTSPPPPSPSLPPPSPSAPRPPLTSSPPTSRLPSSTPPRSPPSTTKPRARPPLQKPPCHLFHYYNVDPLCKISIKNDDRMNITNRNDILNLIRNISATVDKDGVYGALNESTAIVDLVNDVLYNISTLQNLTDSDVEHSLIIVDAIIDVPKVVLVSTQQNYYTITKMIDIVEAIVTNLEKNNTNSINLKLKNINLDSFAPTNAFNFSLGIEAQNKSISSSLYTSHITERSPSTLYSAYFNQYAVKNGLALNSDLRLSFLTYFETKLFTVFTDMYIVSGQCSSNFLSKQVVSVQSNYKLTPVNDQLVYHFFNEFETPSTLCTFNQNAKYDCVFFDSDLNDGNGGWSSLGCSYILANSTTPVCVCNHTTNFAMLMMLTEEQYTTCSWCSDALFYTSIIGAGLSSIFLTISIIIFTIDEVKRVRTHRNSIFQGMFYHYYKLMIALCLNLLIFNAFYIMFTFVTETNTSASICESIGILLHFFLLNSFGMMLSMAILRYLMIYWVFKDIRNFSLISVLASSGLSALLVVIAAFVPPGVSKYITTTKVCWLSGVDILYVVIPIALVTIVNCALFGLVFKEIRNKKNPKKAKTKHSESKENNDKNTQFEMIRVIVVCFFTTGLAWIFGFIVIIPMPTDLEYLSFVFAFLFSALNAFQGVFIFASSILMKTFMAAQIRYLKTRGGKTFKDIMHRSQSEDKSTIDHSKLSQQSSVQTTLSDVEYIYVDDKILYEDTRKLN